MRPEMVRVVCQDLLVDHGQRILCATIRCRAMQRAVRPVAATVLVRMKVSPHRRPIRIQVWINLMLIQLLLLNIKPKIIIRIYMVVVVILREKQHKTPKINVKVANFRIFIFTHPFVFRTFWLISLSFFYEFATSAKKKRNDLKTALLIRIFKQSFE